MLRIIRPICVDRKLQEQQTNIVGPRDFFYSISEEAIKTELNSRREKNATFLAHLKILDKKDAQWSRNKKGHC